MMVETLSLITEGLDILRDKIVAEVEENPQEKKEVIAVFEAIIRPLAIEKAGARIVASSNFRIGRRWMR